MKKKLPARSCVACHKRVEYDYEKNRYVCPEHGPLIFLTGGIPQKLIPWWGGVVSPGRPVKTSESNERVILEHEM